MSHRLNKYIVGLVIESACNQSPSRSCRDTMAVRAPVRKRFVIRLAISLLSLTLPFASLLRPVLAAQPVRDDASNTRHSAVTRGLSYVASIQKNGAVGECRQNTVTALFVLACLSSGVSVDDSLHGPNLRAAGDWLVGRSANHFFGGEEEPNTDHAIAGLAVIEFVGRLPDDAGNRKLMEAATGILEQTLAMQEASANVEYTGGWRRSAKTRANDRVLSAWYLLQLRAASLRGLRVPKSSIERAVDFISASQKVDPAKKEEFGGFSVDYQGLTVRHSSGAGLDAIALYGVEPQRLESAIGWFERHPPRWYGPQFFESNFFAIRGLYRGRALDHGVAFANQLGCVEKLIRERQEPDGSVPFPPGHGEPLIAMGKGYSTAMAILILNVDRGFLPVDQDETASLLNQ